MAVKPVSRVPLALELQAHAPQSTAQTFHLAHPHNLLFSLTMALSLTPSHCIPYTDLIQPSIHQPVASCRAKVTLARSLCFLLTLTVISRINPSLFPSLTALGVLYSSALTWYAQCVTADILFLDISTRQAGKSEALLHCNQRCQRSLVYHRRLDAHLSVPSMLLLKTLAMPEHRRDLVQAFH